MESFFVRFKNALVLMVLLLGQVFCLAVQVRRPAETGAGSPDAHADAHTDAHSVRLLRLWTLAIFSPLERLGTGSGHGVRAAWGNYLGLRHVREENRALQAQLDAVRLERAALAQDALEGHRLEQLLGFQQHYVARTVAAQVIGTSGSDRSRVLTLNKGAADGLALDQAVITPDGVVGKLREVGAHTAQLLLLSDPTAGAGVLLESTRTRTVAHGSATGRVVVTSLVPDSRLKPGERVLTSGGDQVFPRGLPVGTIESIAPDPEHQPYTRITLKTAANLLQLDEVLVITGTAPTLGADAEAELQHDAETAAAAASARLPSIHDGEGPAGKEADPASTAAAPPPAENSRDLIPRPKPTLHPDRYSPGTTPPATELTPGGGPR